MEKIGFIMASMWFAGVLVGAGVGIQLGKWLKTNEDNEKKVKELGEKFD